MKEIINYNHYLVLIAHLGLELCRRRLCPEPLSVNDGGGRDGLGDARAALAQPAAAPAHHLEQLVAHAVRTHGLVGDRRLAGLEKTIIN